MNEKDFFTLFDADKKLDTASDDLDVAAENVSSTEVEKNAAEDSIEKVVA